MAAALFEFQNYLGWDGVYKENCLTYSKHISSYFLGCLIYFSCTRAFHGFMLKSETQLAQKKGSYLRLTEILAFLVKSHSCHPLSL